MSKFIISSPIGGKVFQVGSIIEATGKHSLELSSYVWVILNDTYGNNYLQNPPTVLGLDGKWHSSNLHLGRDIFRITFVKVTKEGNDLFLKKVKNSEWGAFSSFPDGTENLGSIRVKVI